MATSGLASLSIPSGEQVSPKTRWSRPQSRWVPFHYREVHATSKIRRADVASELSYAQSQLTAEQLRPIAPLLQRGDTDGLLVMHNGQVVYEYLIAGVPVWRTHAINSASKVFTGCVAAVLADQGRLDWKAPLQQYVQELEGTGYEGVNIQDALNMRSGIALDAEAEFFALGQHPNQGDTPAIGVIGLTKTGKQSGGPKKYATCVTDTDAAGLACERVAGKPMAELISELVWQPMGAQEDADFTLDNFRTAIFNGAMCATLQDLGRFTNMLLHKGKVGDRQVVPAAFIEDSATKTPSLCEAANGRGVFPGMSWPGSAFHNTFWLDPERKATWNYGAFGNILYVDFDASATCVLLSAWEKPNDQTEEWMAALQELVKSL